MIARAQSRLRCFPWPLLVVAVFVLVPPPAVALAEEPASVSHRGDLRLGETLVGPLPAELGLEVEGGDFIAVVVDQGRMDEQGQASFVPGKGADPDLELVDSGGYVLQARDSLWGSERPERLAWVAGAAQRLHLKLGNKPGGAFRARLELHRPATEDDRALAAADAAIAAAESAYLAGDYRRVEVAFRRAVESLVGIAHPWAEERRLYAMGSLCRLAPDLVDKRRPDVAERFCRVSIDLALAIDELLEAADSYNRLGLLQQNDSRLVGAVASFQRAVDLRAAASPDAGPPATARQADNARTLTNLGVTLGKLGDPRQALRKLHQASEIWEKLGGGEEDEAATHNSLGVLYRGLGDYERARHHYQQALRINRRLAETLEARRHQQRVARTLGNLGWVYLMQDRLELAREHYRQAIDLARRIDDATGEAGALNGLARLETEQGRWAEAEAEALIRRAIELRYVEEDSGGLAGALQTLGDLRAAQQRWAEAEEALDKGYREAESGGRRDLMASIDIRRAEVAAARGDLRRAIELGRRSLEGIDDLRSGVVEPVSRARFVASRRHYYETHLWHLLGAFRSTGKSELLAELFEIAEQAHARSLYEALRRQGAGFEGAPSSGLAEQEREIRQLLAERDVQYRKWLLQRRRREPGAPDEAAIATLESKIDALRLALGDVLSQQRDRDPLSAAFRGLAPIGLETVQNRQLESDELLLHLTLGDATSLLLAIDRRKVEIFELPPRQQLEALARSWLDDLAARADGVGLLDKREADARALAKARKISRLLLDPVAHRLRGQPLVVVPDGIFHAVPFEALPLPGTPDPEERGWFRHTLLDRHELSVQPSMSVVAALREAWERRPVRGAGIAVWADPVFDRDDERLDAVRPRGSMAGSPGARAAPESPIQPHAAIRGIQRRGFRRLPGTARVVDVLRRWRAGTRSFEGFAANQASLAGVGEYGLLHFATHGQVDAERPELSGLALSRFDRQGRELDDDLLTTSEIETLGVNADLVVLSACETALGEALRGEGLLSLNRAFLLAGARRVIASRWPVDDAVTADLMESFYCHLLGEELTPTAALRRAQLELRDRNDKPFFWSAFMLQGEWR